MRALKETAPLRVDRNFEAPSIPLMLTRILQALDDNVTSAEELERLILHDPSLSAHLLKLSNSAFYCFRNEVKTISRCVALLGINLVKSLAIGISIFDSFIRGMQNEAVLINRLWMHSFGVGALAQQIWTRRSNCKEGEHALLCGLLHDLGKVVFFKSDPARYGKLFEMEKRQQDPDICAHEVECYGMDHAGTGAMLAKEWGFPSDLGLVIQKHHTAMTTGIPLVAAISLADMLAKQENIGYDGDCCLREDMPNLLAQLSMGDEEYESMVAFARAKRKDVESFFQLN